MSDGLIPLASSPAEPARGAAPYVATLSDSHFDAPGELRHLEANDAWGALLAALKRRKVLIVSCVGLMTVMVTIMVFVLPQRFSAEALIILDTRRAQIVQQSAVLSNLVSGSIADPAIVRTEVALVSSPAYARKIIEHLNLLDNSAFLVDENADSWVAGVRRTLSSGGKLVSALLNREPPPDTATPMTAAIETLQTRLSVETDDRSYAIRLRYQSRDPKLAAQIVNELADLYVSDQLGTMEDASRKASTWLKDRLATLRAQVGVDERAVAEFEDRHQLETVLTGNLTEQRLSELNHQLMAASNELAQKEAVLKEANTLLAKPGGSAAVAQVLNSQLVQRLREQEATAAAVRDPAGEARVQIIERRINAEIERLMTSLASDVVIGRERKAKLQRGVDDAQARLGGMNAARVRLKGLQQDATASRSMYESVLVRAQQVEADGQSQQPGARTVLAEVPTRPAFPNRILVIGLGFFGSLFLGGLLAFATDRFDETFRTPGQAERLTGVRTLGIIPRVRGGKQALAAIIDSPISPYADAIHNTLIALRPRNTATSRRVIAVSSALPDEGKTIFAATLARAAATARIRTLLIDCDMRRPAVSLAFDREASSALASMFTEGCNEVSRFVLTDESSGLHYLSTNRIKSNPQEILGSRWISDLITRARAEYDLIVLDTPPLLTASDALLLARIADTTLLVVKWGATAKGSVLEALRLLRLHGGGTVGMILSMVDMRRYPLYRSAADYYNNPILS